MKPDYIHDSFPMNRQDLMNVIYGACFFASGGGGPIEMGLEFLEKIQQDVYLINTDKLDDNKKAIAVADMGSPNAVRQGLGYTAPINAFEVLQHHIEEKEGKRVSYLLPMELGALNTLIPFYVASQLENVSVIYAGPCGRSVPQLDMTLLNVANVPICPAAIASDADPNTRDYRSRMFFDVDATTLEDEARNLINTYGQVGGIGCYPMAGADLNRLKPGNEHKLIQGSIGLAWNIGQQILKYEGLDKLSMLLASFSIGSCVFFEGTVTDIIYRKLAGFDLGKVVLRKEKDELWIYFKNESLLAWNPQTKRPAAMGPDGIAYLTLDSDKYPPGTPLSNAGISTGKRYAVMGVEAFKKMRNDTTVTAFMQNIREILEGFRDDKIHLDGYIALEQLHRH